MSEQVEKLRKDSAGKIPADERRDSISKLRAVSLSMDNNNNNQQQQQQPQSPPARQMSTTEIDLESVLQVRRRRLSVTTPQASQDSYRYTDVIILKVEKSNDILKEDSRCIFHGDYHVLTDIFQKYTSHIKIHHDDPEMIKNHDRLSGKIYTTVELPTMSLIEVLEILHKHYFSIVANSTNFGPTTKLQEFILLRNKDAHDTARPLPTIDTKSTLNKNNTNNKDIELVIDSVFFLSVVFFFFRLKKTMSSSSPPSNIGAIDLESVLNVGRRRLTSIGETTLPQQQQRYTDTIYLKREDHSNSLLSIDSNIVIFGELQLLCSIFERYTSNINVYEESNSNKTSFSITFEENEDVIEEEEENTDTSAIVSTLNQTSISSSPPQAQDSTTKRKKLSSIGRSQTVGSTSSDYPILNLEGKRYGCIQLPNMTIIEILEILLRTGLDLVHQSSDYDKENVLHQNFVFSQTRQTPQRLGQSLYSRSSSFIGT